MQVRRTPIGRVDRIDRRLARPGFQRAAAVVAAVGLLVSILAANVPHDSFVNGDPGVKLIAARAALAHPGRALQIDLPSIRGERLPFMEPFFFIHGDHAHALTSEAFVLMSAPLIAAFGVAGAYVLPLLGFLAVMIGCAWLGVALDPRRDPATIAAVAAVCTPFVFYGLEFWEHAPALGAASIGTALLVSARDHRRQVAVAGGLLGAAVLLRPEALWIIVAIGAALRLSPKRPGASDVSVALAACALMLLPLTAYALIHFGSLTTPHVSGNLASLSGGWFASRAGLAAAWFIPSGRHIDFWSVAPAFVLALVPLPVGAARRGRAFLTTVAVLYVVLVLVTAPNDGGAQWGPRYLLFAYVPLTIVVADALSWLASNRWLASIAIGLVLWSLWTDRSAYRDLRISKMIYGRMAAFVEQHSTPDEPIVTDLWWLDQVAARLSNKRIFLYASRPDTRSDLVASIDRGRVPGVVLIASPDESTGGIAAWFTGTCYVPDTEASIPERHLTATHLRRRCSPER
jgi:hypothetical protein